MPDTADVVVIGGGVTGTSIALQLARRGAGNVVLLERDGVASGATGRSSALVRQHCSHHVLARMALHSLRFFQQFPDAEFRQTGFLVLVAPADADVLAANVAMQRSVGIRTQVLTAAEVNDMEPRVLHDDIGAAAWEPESADRYRGTRAEYRRTRRNEQRHAFDAHCCRGSRLSHGGTGRAAWAAH